MSGDDWHGTELITDQLAEWRDAVTNEGIEESNAANLCDWGLRKLADCDKHEAWLTDMAEQAAHHWQQQMDKAKERRQRLVEYMRPYADELINAQAEMIDRKGVQLPCGYVGYKTSEKWTWDDDKVMQWLKDGPELADFIVSTTTERIDKTELKAECKKTGVLPDGVQVDSVTEFVARPKG